MTESPDIREILFADDCLCPDCRTQIRRVARSYRIERTWVHVLLEKNAFLEDLCTRFIGMRDVALAPVFLHREHRLLRHLRHRRLSGVATRPDLVARRGSDPLEEILDAACLPVSWNWQQADREGLLPTTRHEEPVRTLVLSLEPESIGDPPAFLKQSGCRELLVLMASPEWLQRHKKDRRPHPLFR